MSGLVLGIVGFIVFDVIAVVLVGLWRHRGSSQAVVGPPPGDLPDWVPQMAPGQVDLTPGTSGMPDVAAIIANVQAAAADGQLTEGEIQAMFPGAQIVRSSDGTTVAHAASAQAVPPPPPPPPAAPIPPPPPA
jgi:hypothetical protein